MLKRLNIPIIVAICITLLFIFQGIQIVNLSSKKDENTEILNLIYKSKEIIHDIKNIQNKSTLIYEFGIYDKDDNVLYSKLSIPPKNRDFQILKSDGYLYYKTSFIDDRDLLFLIVAKKLDYTKFIFLATLMVIITIIVVFALMYVSYESISKPYQEQKRLMGMFFNDAMHELKTPLGIATINLEMLGYKDKHTHRIKSALKEMKVTYEDVEFFIKNSYTNLPKIKINFSYFLLSRVKFISTIANVKNIKILTNIEKNLEIFMSEIEAIRLVDNNLSNAIKYSKENSKILINLTKINDDFILFSVEDFGRGIKDTNEIWKRYTREDYSQGGFGLGLNIISSICKKYGISYDVKSVYTKGSIFSYKIPIYMDKILDNI
ncbi:sensor histidine kinase [Campylobacter sputorum]|uniref:sensor histidine kinase n=1 Tax=Campylobacter sputorum TaxID=206 RepID=UPI00053BE3BA|nr:HAMP domain-containing sensor histidine kinase [Campylobacter sputorum]